MYKRTHENLHKELPEASHHSRRKSAICEAITYGHTDCLNDPRLLQNSVATMKPSWTSEINRKFNKRTTSFKPSTQKWDEVSPAVTDKLTDNKLEGLYQMHVEKSKELKYLLQVYAQETTFGGNTYDYCRSKLMSQRHLEKQNLGFLFQNEKSRCQTCNGSSEQREGTKGKGKDNCKSNSVRGDCVRWITDKHDPNKQAKGKERLRSPSPAGSPH